jgi:hypothetical protein
VLSGSRNFASFAEIKNWVVKGRNLPNDLDSKRLLQERSFFGLGFGFFGGDDYGCGYFVLIFEVEEFNAHGAAAGGADGFGIDPDDLTGWVSTAS